MNIKDYDKLQNDTKERILANDKLIKSISSYHEEDFKMNKRLSFGFMILFIILLVITGCGSEQDEIIENESIEDATSFDAEPDTLTIVMCQQAIACDSEGVCVDTEKPIEFTLDETTLYWQACYNFEPCDENERTGFSLEEIENYREAHCDLD